MDLTRTFAGDPGSSASAAKTTFQDGLVCSPVSPLVDLRRTCIRVAATQATVLLTGETGTGKEVFARLIHANSPRAKHPFVPVNCSAIPEALLESELFGYVKGAFTGATHPRRGRVALGEGGTLMLDEIGELPLGLQVKLLRLLQERTYEPVGSSESVVADFRLVAATNRNLVEEVRLGRFRKDLYYRLNVCPIHLPPLRERRGDIAELFFHFWQGRGERREIDAAVIERLQLYEWPGNVRELENLVERLSVIAEGDVIRLEDLPSPLWEPVEHAESSSLETTSLLTSGYSIAVPPASTPEPSFPFERPLPLTTPTPAPLDPEGVRELLTDAEGGTPRPEVLPRPHLALPVDLPGYLRDLEKAYIDEALTQTGGNKKEAARLLGMGRTTLVEKLRRRNAGTSAA